MFVYYLKRFSYWFPYKSKNLRFSWLWFKNRFIIYENSLLSDTINNFNLSDTKVLNNIVNN